jgi:rubrerythrin
MMVRLKQLLITTRQTTENLGFSDSVTFLYGPVGTGKSTVARLIDYCFGGDLERTPAIQQEFVAVQLAVNLGDYHCTLERASTDTQSVRVSWSRHDTDIGSVNAPLAAGDVPVLGEEIYNLSDLLCFLCGITPIKVRKRTRDPDSPMVRLSFRDMWSYCYLDQTHLDSSFFRLEDPFRGRKSQDAMRFFTGLHSERLSQLETELFRAIDEQQGKRAAVLQIRQFMMRFHLGSELDVAGQIAQTRREQSEAEARRQQLERDRDARVHPTDGLREQLRAMGSQIGELLRAIRATEEAIAEQRALRAELITSKIKADRTEHAGRLLEGVEYARCPQCGTDVSERIPVPGSCRLCGSPEAQQSTLSSLELEAMRRELNDRIDQIADSIERRERALGRSKRQLEQLRAEKSALDQTLQRELARYDSAFVESVRALDREVATLTERLRSLDTLQEMPRAINALEEEAGALQGAIDRLRSAIDEERSRLRLADENVAVIAARFKSIMLSVGFPGVVEADEVVIDTRNWRPVILHGGQEWSFWDAGSGGKKTLFNVCYALAVHEAARERGMPVPNVLVIDSPTKNISDDENPELVRALYWEIYRLASTAGNDATQFLLIDSDLVQPENELPGFAHRRLAGVPDAPSLIPYYTGP